MMKAVVFGKEVKISKEVFDRLREAIENGDYDRAKSILKDVFGGEIPKSIERARSLVIVRSKEIVIITETPVFG